MNQGTRRHISHKLSQEQVSQIVDQWKAIRSVYDAHLDLNDQQEVYSIGIFADGSRTAKRVKREAEEAFRSVARYKVDYRKINIILDAEEVPPPEKWRIRLEKVLCERTARLGWEAYVALRVGRQRFSTRMEIEWGECDPETLVGRVAARVLSFIAWDPIRFEGTKTATIANHELVLASLHFFNPQGREGLYVGTVFRTEDLYTDVVRACLDALNRQIDLKPYMQYEKKVLAQLDPAHTKAETEEPTGLAEAMTQESIDATASLLHRGFTEVVTPVNQIDDVLIEWIDEIPLSDEDDGTLLSNSEIPLPNDGALSSLKAENNPTDASNEDRPKG